MSGLPRRPGLVALAAMALLSGCWEPKPPAPAGTGGVPLPPPAAPAPAPAGAPAVVIDRSGPGPPVLLDHRRFDAWLTVNGVEAAGPERHVVTVSHVAPGLLTMTGADGESLRLGYRLGDGTTELAVTSQDELVVEVAVSARRGAAARRIVVTRRTGGLVLALLLARSQEPIADVLGDASVRQRAADAIPIAGSGEPGRYAFSSIPVRVETPADGADVPSQKEGRVLGTVGELTVWIAGSGRRDELDLLPDPLTESPAYVLDLVAFDPR